MRKILIDTFKISKNLKFDEFQTILYYTHGILTYVENIFLNKKELKRIILKSTFNKLFNNKTLNLRRNSLSNRKLLLCINFIRFNIKKIDFDFEKDNATDSEKNIFNFFNDNEYLVIDNENNINRKNSTEEFSICENIIFNKLSRTPITEIISREITIFFDCFKQKFYKNLFFRLEQYSLQNENYNIDEINELIDLSYNQTMKNVVFIFTNQIDIFVSVKNELKNIDFLKINISNYNQNHLQYIFCFQTLVQTKKLSCLRMLKNFYNKPTRWSKVSDKFIKKLEKFEISNESFNEYFKNIIKNLFQEILIEDQPDDLTLDNSLFPKGSALFFDFLIYYLRNYLQNFNQFKIAQSEIDLYIYELGKLFIKGYLSSDKINAKIYNMLQPIQMIVKYKKTKKDHNHLQCLEYFSDLKKLFDINCNLNETIKNLKTKFNTDFESINLD
ncbi:hypothetical protein GVAV_002903 [Gurleya vavrai]